MPRLHAPAKRTREVITFKVEGSLLEMLAGIPNRSEFIRNALLSALGNACPLCRGNGILTPEKKKHWTEFSQDHAVQKCRDCHELTIVCRNE